MAVTDQIQVEVVDREGGWKILDAAARRHLGMSAQEFLDAWNAGELADRVDTPDVIQVAMLMPFAR